MTHVMNRHVGRVVILASILAACSPPPSQSATVEATAEIIRIAPSQTPASIPTLTLTPPSITLLPTGPIIFVSNRQGRAELYSMQPDDSSQQRIVSNVDILYAPAESPDGRHIAFISSSPRDRPGNRFTGDRLYIFDVSTSKLRLLLVGTLAPYSGVAWSADSNALLFASRSDQPGIYHYDLISGQPARLTTAGDSPIYSSDGQRILFLMSTFSIDEGPPQIFMMNADGTSLHQVTSADQAYYDPVWLPDNQTILCRARDVGTAELYVINVDNQVQRQLTFNQNVTSLALSPTGKFLAFTSAADQAAMYFHIYLLDVESSSAIRLTDTPGAYFDLHWSPDAKHLLFTNFELAASQKSSNNKIYSLDISSRQTQNLSRNPAADSLAIWTKK